MAKKSSGKAQVVSLDKYFVKHPGRPLFMASMKSRYGKFLKTEQVWSEMLDVEKKRELR
jgi:bacillopeptidase F (M6 metalloprotease family)